MSVPYSNQEHNNRGLGMLLLTREVKAFLTREHPYLLCLGFFLRENAKHYIFSAENGRNLYGF